MDGNMQWITSGQWEQLAAEGTDAHRVGNGRGEWVDRYGDRLLWSAETPDPERLADMEKEIAAHFGFHPDGWLVRVPTKSASDQEPAHVLAGEDPGRLAVHEAGVVFLVEPAAGYSSGLFLDQRLNRRWVRGLRPRRMLNLFAYTGGFSVCAALGGGETTSVDVSKRALEVARENFRANSIDPSSGHRFIAEDAVAYASRLSKRGEAFDLIVLDPPTFGRAGKRVFQLDRDLGALTGTCIGLLAPGGWLLVSCNASAWRAGRLEELCRGAAGDAHIRIEAGEHPPEIPRSAVSWRLRRDVGRI